MKAVNLLPPDLRSGPRTSAPAGVPALAAPAGGPGAYIVLGALALAVVALVGYVLAANTVKQRQADLAAVNARAQAVQRQVSALKPYADFDAVAKARVKTVDDLVSRRFRWDRALGDLSRAVPADVTLTTLQGTASSAVTTSGGGSGGLRAAMDVPAVELQGCTTGQTDVARLMSRLHDVDGVTRVSLASSDKESVSQRPAIKGEGAGGATSAAVAAAGACGTGDHPSFDLVAVFGNDAPTGGTASASGASTAGANLAASAAEASSQAPSSTTTTTSDQGAK
jgi:Tfp pilus assembly protein PilN